MQFDSWTNDSNKQFLVNENHSSATSIVRTNDSFEPILFSESKPKCVTSVAIYMHLSEGKSFIWQFNFY